MTDYYPSLTDEILLCSRCGDRVHLIGPDLTPYCYRCGNHGTWPVVKYLRADGAIRIEKDSAIGGSLNT